MVAASPNVVQLIAPGQPVKAFLGLKKRQWSQRTTLRTVARDCLESNGISNIVSVSCFLKTGKNAPLQIDPNFINLFLRLNGSGNSVDII